MDRRRIDLKIYGPIIFLTVSVGLVWADENNPATQLQQKDAKTIETSSNLKMDPASRKPQTKKKRLRVRATLDVVDPQRPVQDVFTTLRSQTDAERSDLGVNAHGVQQGLSLDPNQREAAAHGRARSDRVDRKRLARGEGPHSRTRERLSNERRLGPERPER